MRSITGTGFIEIIPIVFKLEEHIEKDPIWINIEDIYLFYRNKKDTITIVLKTPQGGEKNFFIATSEHELIESIRNASIKLNR